MNKWLNLFMGLFIGILIIIISSLHNEIKQLKDISNIRKAMLTATMEVIGTLKQRCKLHDLTDNCESKK